MQHGYTFGLYCTAPPFSHPTRAHMHAQTGIFKTATESSSNVNYHGECRGGGDDMEADASSEEEKEREEGQEKEADGAGKQQEQAKSQSTDDKSSKDNECNEQQRGGSQGVTKSKSGCYGVVDTDDEEEEEQQQQQRQQQEQQMKSGGGGGGDGEGGDTHAEEKQDAKAAVKIEKREGAIAVYYVKGRDDPWRAREMGVFHRYYSDEKVGHAVEMFVPSHPFLTPYSTFSAFLPSRPFLPSLPFLLPILSLLPRRWLPQWWTTSAASSTKRSPSSTTPSTRASSSPPARPWERNASIKASPSGTTPR